MVNCMECIHIDVCIKAATSHIDHCNYYSFAGNTVEVVRCRDCKHYNEGFCTGYHANHDIMPDDFCSYGERKDGDGNG